MTLHNLTLANLNLSDLNAVLDYIQQRNISDWGGSITAASYGSQTANTVLSGPTAAPSANPTFRVLVAADIPSLDASKITTGQLALARGGTHADLSATGGANQFVRQSTVGGAFTVSAIGAADITTITLKDTNFTLQDDGDTTKQIQFQLSSIATATTRILTVPNASFILAGQNIDNAFSVDQTFNGSVLAYGGTNASVAVPAVGLLNNKIISWKDAAGAFTNCAFIWTDSSNNLIFGAGNSSRVWIDTSGNVGIGKTPSVRLHVGAGTTGTNAEKVVVDSGSGTGGHGSFQVYRNGVFKAALIVSGSASGGIGGDAANDLGIVNTQAINFSADGGTTIHASINTSGTLSALGSLVARNGTAIPAGGTAGVGVMVSSTSNFGVFFGSGAPTLSAAKGSLYLRSDGTTTNDRAYINTNGSTTWTALTTAA